MKKILNKFWPVLVIFLVWFAFSSPYLFRGKVPFPSDYLVNVFAPWSAYPEFASPVKSGATPDVITQIYPWKHLTIDIWKTGAFPLWNPYAFSGTPLLGNYQSAALSPLNLLYIILPFIDAWSIQVLLAPLLAGLFTYLYIRSLNLTKAAALISSLAFMFCGFITTWMAYGTLSYAILFLPLALFAIEKLYGTRKWYFSILLSLSIPLSFFSGHFQTSLYFLLFILAYVIFKYFQTKDLKSLIFNLSSIFFGLLISAPQLLPSVEFYAESVRSAIFIKTEVIPWSYLPTLLAPDFLGNPVTRNDWFGHYAEWNAYIGLVPLMLGFYSLRKRNQYINFFTVSSIIVILLSFQTPLVDLLIASKIPVLSTSALSRIIVLFSFSYAVLAGFGLDTLITDIKNRNLKPVLIWVGTFVVVFATLWLVVVLKLFMPPEKIVVSRSNLILPTLILFAAFVSVLLPYFIKNKKIIILLLTCLILVTAFDVFRFAKKWMPFEQRSLVYPQVPVSKFLSTLAGYNRVFGNFGAEAATTLRVPSIEGYDPLYVSRYGELVEGAADGLFHTPTRSVVLLAKNARFQDKLVDLLGVKYFVQKKSDGREVWAYPIWKYPLDTFKIVYEDPSYQIFENRKVFPRAFFVGNVKVISDKRDILSEMFSEKSDLSKVVLLEEKVEDKALDSSGSVRIKDYEPNKVQIGTISTGSALLVLTDPYYPGWKAYVDGQETKIYRADYALRAIFVPKGEHSVTFIYDPNSFKIGMHFTILGFLGMSGVGFYLWKQKFRS